MQVFIFVLVRWCAGAVVRLSYSFFLTPVLWLNPLLDGISFENNQQKREGVLIFSTHPVATSVLHKHPGILPLNTIHGPSNLLNLQTHPSMSHKSANEWNGENRPNSECTHVRCQGHSSMFGASAPL